MSLLEQMKMSPAQATEMFIKLRDTKKAKDDEHKKSVVEACRCNGQARRGPP